MTDIQADEGYQKDAEAEKPQVSPSTQIANIIVAFVGFGLSAWWLTDLLTKP